VFREQAIDVAQWDKNVMENGDKIFKLHSEALRVQVAQKELDQNLEILYTQQNELHQLLASLENEVETLANEIDMNPTDVEREKGYQLAEDINSQLDQMGNTVKELITKLNTSQEKSVDAENPIAQIVKILNSHLNSLQWIDQNSAILQSRIQDVSKHFTFQKGEQERIHGRK